MVEGASVIVVGAGNAGMCAAIAAAEAGSDVLVIDKAPEGQRGGNSSLTLNFRFAHFGAHSLAALINRPLTVPETELLEDVAIYPPESFSDDLGRITQGDVDRTLHQLVAQESYEAMKWLTKRGLRWVVNHQVTAGRLPLWPRGAGWSVQRVNYRHAKQLGIRHEWSTELRGLDLRADGRISGVFAQAKGRHRRLRAGAVVLASGGFQASSRLRRAHLGENWKGVRVRGVPFNNGRGIEVALEAGAAAAGEWSSCHASPQAAELPKYSLPDKTRDPRAFWRYSYHLGVMVDRGGERFIDEGEDVPSMTYAKCGHAILSRPGKIAFQIFDGIGTRHLPGHYDIGSNGLMARSIEELASVAGISRTGLVQTIEQYNRAAPPGPVTPSVLDGVATSGIFPPKSNWARPLRTPPFVVFPVVCGITFTFGGLRINGRAEVQRASGGSIAGLYAAGEVVGRLFGGNYPGGSGMTAGTVFGRIAGQAAAKYAETALAG